MGVRHIIESIAIGEYRNSYQLVIQQRIKAPMFVIQSAARKRINSQEVVGCYRFYSHRRIPTQLAIGYLTKRQSLSENAYV